MAPQSGHAGTSPTPPGSHNTSTVSTRSAEYNVCSHDYSLIGGPFRLSAVPLNFYLPDLERYPAQRYNPVQQLDIGTVWRGLSSTQAEELSFWEELFRVCLERRIRPYLRYMSQSDLLSHNHSAINLNIPALVFDMVEEFESSKDCNSSLTWFTGMDIFQAVANFISIHECFSTPVTPRSQHFARLDVTRIDRDKRAAEVKWYPPRLSFDDLVISTFAGALYYLRPRYPYPPALQIGEIRYYSDCSWLKYNYATACFNGQVPQSIREEKIIVCATVKHDFGNGVLHEQLLRSAVTLQILPAQRKKCTSSNNTAETVPQTICFRTLPKLKRTIQSRRPLLYSTLPFCTTRPSAAEPLEPISPPLSPLQPHISASTAPAVTNHTLRGAELVKKSSATSQASPQRSLQDTSGESELEMSNSFAILANRTDMDRPTSEDSTLGSDDSCTPEVISSLFDTVRSKFHADYDERSRVSPRRSKNASMSMESDLITCNPLSLKESAYSSREDAGHDVLDINYDAQAAKTIRAVQHLSFGNGEDPRDVRQMRQDILNSELKKMELKMMHKRVGKWVGSGDVAERALNMTSIDESELE